MSAVPNSQPIRKQSPVAEQAIAHYISLSEQLSAASHNHVLAARRQDAQRKLKQNGLPTRRDEDWQYTPLNGWMKIPFSKKQPGQVDFEKFQALLPEYDSTLMVFVDGYFADDLSSDFAVLPDGLNVELGETTNAALSNSDEPFEILHDMLSDKQLKIQVAKNVVLDQPIHLICLQTQNEHICNRSIQLQVAENAEVTFIQHQISLNETGISFVNSFTQIQLADNARCQQFVVQELNDKSFYFANQRIQQAASSVFNTLYVGLGAEVSRQQNRLDLQGKRAEANQNSIVWGDGKQVMDSRTDTRHSVAHCDSHQLHKYVMQGEARGVFNGMIYVDQQAQKTDGQMDNKNLLLSDKAKVDAKPQLEIYADDVKCSHGCATGQIDEDQVFYCQTRGISKQDAMQLITQAFLFEPLDQVSNLAVRQWLSDLVDAHLHPKR